MKDIPKWLAERLPQLKKPVEDDQPNDTESVNPDDEVRSEMSLAAEVAGWMDNHDAEKNVVMPVS